MEFFSIGGCGITLAQWLHTLRHRRKDAAQGERKETIEDYLEWLRRERQTELLKRLEEADDAREAISRLSSTLDRNDDPSRYGLPFGSVKCHLS